MTVRKVKGGYKIYHCRSGKKGPINATKKPVSKAKAQSIHRAIMANKSGSSKRKSTRRRKRK